MELTTIFISIKVFFFKIQAVIFAEDTALYTLGRGIYQDRL
jgi:hypothetical protein